MNCKILLGFFDWNKNLLVDPKRSLFPTDQGIDFAGYVFKHTYTKIRIPEPTRQEIFDLVNEIKEKCKIEIKNNLDRLLS